MKLHLDRPGSVKLFTAHAHDHVMVNGVRYDHSIAVLADEVRDDWRVADFSALTGAHFSYFLPLKPEVILLGSGTRQQFASPQLFQSLTAAGIGVECMDTPAACRTYNILIGEGRKVIAAILL